MDRNVTDAEVVAATFRNISDADAFDDMLDVWGLRIQSQLAEGKFADLSPEMRGHVEQALAQLQRNSATPLDDPIDQAVDISAPAMVISPEQIVVAANDDGMDFFGATKGRSVALDWLDSRSATAFADIVQSAKVPSNRSQAVLRLVEDGKLGGMAEAFHISPDNGRTKMIAIRSLQVEWSAGVDTTLAEAFELTDAEIEVAKVLFETRDTADIAERRGASIHTVRNQIKSIQAKTDVSSKVDLVRLLTLLAQRNNSGPQPTKISWRDPWGREKTAIGPNGMRIAYSWTGDPSGRDVLIVPSIMHGYAFPERIEHQLKAAGIRLWAIQRPGMGNSTAQEYSRQAEMDALKTVIEHNAMRDVILVSLTGTIEPVRAVLRDPHLYKSVIMAGMVSPPTKAVRKMMPRMEVAMNGACRKSPLLGRLMVEMSMRNAKIKGLEWLVQRMFSNSAADRGAMSKIEMQPLLRDAFAFNLTFDPVLTAWMVGITLEPWDIPLHDLAVPVHALVGTDLAYHHPPSIDAFANKSDLFTWEPVEGCGLKMLYQRPDLIAERIIAAVDA